MSFFFFILRYDDEDYNQFATRDPWADLSSKQSTTAPLSSSMKSPGGKQNSGT